MDYHTAASTEFAYSTDYMICNTSYYSDTDNPLMNGLLIARIHGDPCRSSWQFKMSSNDLTTFYLPDLLQLLNCRDENFKQIAKHHKKASSDMCLIDYDELKQCFEQVDDLTKMSMRLQIIGASACSIENNRRRFSIGACLQGRVSNPDNLFVPSSNFFDSKVDHVCTVAEYLVSGRRKKSYLFQDKRSSRYALSGSVIYLVVFKRNGVFSYMVYLSEEPISVLQQAINECETVAKSVDLDFDYIYTVVGRTNTKDDSIPYVLTPEGIYFKDIILYCNENGFSSPVLLELKHYIDVCFQDKKTIQSQNYISSSLMETRDFLNLKSLFVEYPPPEDIAYAADLFRLLTKYHDRPVLLRHYLNNLKGFDSSILEDYCLNPLQEALTLGKDFIAKHHDKINQTLLHQLLCDWYIKTSDANVQTLIRASVEEVERQGRVQEPKTFDKRDQKTPNLLHMQTDEDIQDDLYV